MNKLGTEKKKNDEKYKKIISEIEVAKKDNLLLTFFDYHLEYFYEIFKFY